MSNLHLKPPDGFGSSWKICHKHLSEKIEKFRDNELKDRHIRATADFPKRVSVFYVMRLITGIFSMMKTGGSLTRGPLRS